VPPHSSPCLFDWSNSNHIDLGQLRAAVQSGQLPPDDEKLGAIQEKLVALIADKATPTALVLQVIDVIIACERADLARIQEALRSLRLEELAELFRAMGFPVPTAAPA